MTGLAALIAQAAAATVAAVDAVGYRAQEAADAAKRMGLSLAALEVVTLTDGAPPKPHRLTFTRHPGARKNKHMRRKRAYAPVWALVDGHDGEEPVRVWKRVGLKVFRHG